MQKIKEVLAESYQNAIRKHFNEYNDNIAIKLNKLSPDNKEAVLNKFLDQYETDKVEIERKWSNAPLEGLNGKTPAEVIQSIEKLEDVFEIFIYMSGHTDEEVPFLLVDKLNSFGQRAISLLLEFVNSRKQSEGHEEYEFLEAVSAIGMIGMDESINPLIQLAYDMQDNEPMLEHIEEALKNVGAGIIQPVLERLETSKFGKVEKMLLYVLASVGSMAKEDRIYLKLRDAFREMEEKIPAVICLSVYGDGRAVPMLRGFLKKYTGILSGDLFYEIIGSIRNLGGETEEFM